MYKLFETKKRENYYTFTVPLFINCEQNTFTMIYITNQIIQDLYKKHLLKQLKSICRATHQIPLL